MVQGGSPLKNRLILFVSLPKKSSCHFFGAFFFILLPFKNKKVPTAIKLDGGEDLNGTAIKKITLFGGFP